MLSRNFNFLFTLQSKSEKLFNIIRAFQARHITMSGIKEHGGKSNPKDIDTLVTEWKKRNTRKQRISCPYCRSGIVADTGGDSLFHAFQRHFKESHADLLDSQAHDSPEAFIKANWTDALAGSSQKHPALGLGQKHSAPGPGGLPSAAGAAQGIGTVGSSPGSKGSKREGSRSRSSSRSPSPTKRAKGQPISGTDTKDIRAEFTRPPYQGNLWTPEDITATISRPRQGDKPNVSTHQQYQQPHTSSRPKLQSRQSQQSSDSETQIMKQPETKAITPEQLVTEVKGIYAGLVMVESKCIEVDNAQSAAQSDSSKMLSDEQWQALIALHRTYLNEHHDFFLASQHPAATPALRRLPAKYAMPARMWRHGIHSFLEVLRHRLPASYEHMISFIYLAYSMIALLFETVPAFEETWMECLGDLARYRMAIEDDDIRDREIWAGVSRQWYSKASDKSPTTGRLYHHLAILARPNATQQLYYYSKSLCVEIPFIAARESIMTLFDPIMSPTPNPQQMKLTRPELLFVRTHGILFSLLAGKQPREDPEGPMNEMLQLLDPHIARSTLSWRSTG